MDGDITLICPRGAKPGQQLLFRDESGARFSTELPAGVTAGMKFTAKRNRPPRPGSGTQRRENPMGASFRGRDGQTAPLARAITRSISYLPPCAGSSQ